MRKIAFLFAFLVGSMNMFANEITTQSDAAEYLLEFEVPLEIGVPDQVFVLSDIITNNTVFDLLDQITGIIDDIAGLLLPDKITLDILGVPGGVVIGNFGLDVSAWEIELGEAQFNAIAGTEGATVSGEIDILGLVKITLVISVLGA